ncbi:MAG: SxtJ family membrane protein [Candidatus Omnitrophota bacterium]
MKRLNPDKNDLKNFGLTMGAVFFILSLTCYFKGKAVWPAIFGISIILFAFGIIAPALLRQVYLNWMRFASVLGWVNTRVILLVIFYAVFMPIGLIGKLFGADPLDRKIEKDKKSYWLKKEDKPFNPLDYERQF